MDHTQSSLALEKDMWEQAKDFFDAYKTIIIGLVIVLIVVILYFAYFKETLVSTSPGATRKYQIASFSGSDAFTSNSASGLDVNNFDAASAGCTGKEVDQMTEDQAYAWMSNNVTRGGSGESMVGGKKNLDDNKLSKILNGM